MYVYNQPTLERKNIIKLAAVIAFLMASAVFWGLSAGAAAEAEKGYGQVVQIRSEGQLLNVERLADLLENRDFEKEDIRFTAWSQENDVTIENYSLGARTRLDCALYYFGDNSEMFDLVLDNGCALSEAAAFSVFGTASGILGETVVIGGENYVVEKLLYGSTAPLIYKVGEDDSRAGFDALDVVFGEGAEMSASELRMVYGVGGDITVYYGSVVKAFMALGKLALLIAFAAFALIALGGLTKGMGKWLRRAVMAGGLALACFCCLALVGSPFYIPGSFIPTRWSEFEFWSSTFSNFGDSWNYYFSMKTYAPDILFRSYIVKTVVFAAISASLAIISAVVLRGMASGHGRERHVRKPVI